MIYYIENSEKPSSPVIEFSYEPDKWQNKAFNAIEKQNEDIIINCPTASGKTTAIIYAIVHCVKKLNKKVLVGMPIKSLSNEKYNEFKKIFEEYNIQVGIMTGDNKINENADILLITTEILKNRLYQQHESIAEIGCVIFDEIHYMNDEERGKNWELSIIGLDSTVQLIMLSGTIGNLEQFGRWISTIRNKKVALIKETERIIPLHHHIYVNGKMYNYMIREKYDSISFTNAKNAYTDLTKEREKKRIKHDVNNDIKGLVKYLKNNDMLQAIVFSFSRKECEKYAEIIGSTNINYLNDEEQIEVSYLFKKHIESVKTEDGKNKYENIEQIYRVKKLLMCGVCFHHSTMLQNLRELVEIMMKKKLIKILFATETLCIGVNVPSKTTVFTSVIKPTNNTRRLITSTEYRQMAGRAGRRGLDIKGDVIYLPLYDFVQEENLKGIVMGTNENIVSHLKFDYKTVLQMIKNEMNGIEIYKKSLMNFELLVEKKEYYEEMNNISHSNSELISDLEKQEISEDIQYIIQRYIDYEINKAHKIYTSDEKKIISDFTKIKKDYNDCYNLKRKITNGLKKYEITKHKYEKSDKYIETIYNQCLNVLHTLNYIDENNKLLEKGVICSYISECDEIVLTEMITNDYFDSMSNNEIVGFLSIFTDPIKKDEPYGLYEFDGTLEIHNKIKKLDEFVQLYKNIESKTMNSINCKDFLICTDYIDITMQWENQSTIHDLIAQLNDEVDIESFCKNMNKIGNILLIMKSICETQKFKISLIPRLEEMHKNIIRDIMHVNSLYIFN